MKTPFASYLLFLAAALLGALGQYFYKSGADRASGGWTTYFNLHIIAGVICYITVMVFFVAAFKRGGQLHVLYPVYASTFIFAALLSWWAYGQPIRLVHIAGMFFLVLGMSLMGK